MNSFFHGSSFCIFQIQMFQKQNYQKQVLNGYQFVSWISVSCRLRPQSSKFSRHGFSRPRVDVQLGLTSLVFQQQSHLVKKQHFRQPCPIDLSRYLTDSHHLLHHRHRFRSQLYSVWQLRGNNPKVHRLGHKYFSALRIY